MLQEFPGKPKKKHVRALESLLSSSPSIAHPLARAELGEAGLEPGAVPVVSTVDSLPTSGSGPCTGGGHREAPSSSSVQQGRAKGCVCSTPRVLPPKISTVLVKARKEDPPSLEDLTVVNNGPISMAFMWRFISVKRG